MTPRRLALVFAVLSLTGAGGCRHYGPPAIAADPPPYNEAVPPAGKEQPLLNIVRLRYADTPFFVDVPQITSGYTLQGTATTNAAISPPTNPLASFAQQLGGGLNLQAVYQDRPTI